MQRQLYEHFYGKMMGVCMRYAGCRDEAADILNQGFYKVFKNIKKYDSGAGAFEAWIRRIMINTAIDHYRKEMRRKDTADIEHAYGAGEESSVIADLNAEQILGLVQQLTPAYRAAFNLYVIEGLNHREIGEKLGITEGTSKSNLAKARAKLQKKVAGLFEMKKEQYVK